MSADEAKPEFSLLAALLASTPYTITGQWYFQQTFSLDGYRFVRCRFDACSLFTSKGTFFLDHCLFAGCMVYMEDQARSAVQLASIVIPEIRERWPHVAFEQENDGTLSIKSWKPA